MDIEHVIYLFVYQGFFPYFFAIMNNIAVGIRVHVFMGIMFSFLCIIYTG